MYFTSPEFFVFLILLFAGYYIFFKSFQWQFLLLASFVFYAFSGWQNLVYISITIISTWFSCLKMEQLLKKQEEWLALNKGSAAPGEETAYKTANKKKRRAWFLVCLIFNLLILALVKYSNFAISNINSLLSFFGSGKSFSLLNILMPMGISFYTFQTMSLLIDSYREKKSGFAEKNIFKAALFTSFFPQLIQGPISRRKDLYPQLFTKKSFNSAGFSDGFIRVLLGYFKKLIIADRLLIAVNFLTENTREYQGIYVILGIFFYAVCLYADFTGGIDISIGVAKMLGIKISENFHRPFYSKNIGEYWRRWHISMGTWFRDYVFYPLAVSKPMLSLQKKCRKALGNGTGTRISTHICILILWLTTGIWHGPSWNFIVWGLVNGLLIIISAELTPLYKSFHNKFPFLAGKGYSAFQIARTFILMSFIRAFDIYPGVALTFKMYASILTNLSLGKFAAEGLSAIGLSAGDYIVCALAVAALIVAGALNRRSKDKKYGFVQKAALLMLMFFSVLVFGMYGIGYDSSQFIYNRF